MKTKVAVYLYWQASTYSANGGRYEVATNDRMGELFPEYTLLGSQEVEFDADEFDSRELMIGALRAEKDKVIGEATQKAEQIEEKIQQLLALPASAAA